MSMGRGRGITMATVLLGSGCRGITTSNAARVAAEACIEFNKELMYSESKPPQSKSNVINTTAEVLVSTTCTDVKKGAVGDIDDEVNCDVNELHFILREEDDCHLLVEYLLKAKE